jgi:hypothetical protein
MVDTLSGLILEWDSKNSATEPARAMESFKLDV